MLVTNKERNRPPATRPVFAPARPTLWATPAIVAKRAISGSPIANLADVMPKVQKIPTLVPMTDNAHAKEIILLALNAINVLKATL